MKKFTLAIAISSLAVSAAHAKTFTDEDGSSLDVTGKVGFILSQGTDGSDLAFASDALDLGFAPSYMVSEDMTVFASLALTGSSMTVDSAYIGMDISGISITYGNQSYVSDSFGIGTDKNFGIGGSLASTGGLDTLAISYPMDSFLIAVSTDFEDGESTDSSIDIFGEFYLTNITLAATAQSQTDSAYVGFSGVFSDDAYSVGGEVTMDLDAEATAFEVAGSYAIDDKLSLGAGLGIDASEAFGVYINAGYSISSNASAFVEIASADEVGFATGMSVSF